MMRNDPMTRPCGQCLQASEGRTIWIETHGREYTGGMKRTPPKQRPDQEKASSSGPLVPVVAILVVIGLIVWLISGPGAAPPKTEPASSAVDQVTAQPGVAASRPSVSIPSAPPSEPEVPEELRPEAEVVVKPASVMMGYVRPEEVRRTTVQLTNDSGKPLEITGVKRGCSCTEVEMTPGTLLPGQSMPLTTVFTAGLTPTTKNNKVKVQVKGHKTIEIPMRAIVSRPVRVEPANFAMHQGGGYDGPVSRDTGRIRVTSTDGRPFRVLSAGGEPPIRWPGSSGDPQTNPSEQHDLVLDLSAYERETLQDKDGTVFPPFWVVETDHPDSPTIEVRLQHTVHRVQRREEDRNWVFVENRVVVDPVAPGGSTTFNLPIIWSRGGPGSQQIREAVSSSPEFSAELVQLLPDGNKSKAVIRITPSSETRGVFQGIVELVSAEHRARLPVIGYVQDPPVAEDAGS